MGGIKIDESGASSRMASSVIAIGALVSVGLLGRSFFGFVNDVPIPHGELNPYLSNLRPEVQVVVSRYSVLGGKVTSNDVAAFEKDPLQTLLKKCREEPTPVAALVPFISCLRSSAVSADLNTALDELVPRSKISSFIGHPLTDAEYAQLSDSVGIKVSFCAVLFSGSKEFHNFDTMGVYESRIPLR